MAAVIVITIEGVLTNHTESVGIPIAMPSLAGIDLVTALSERWPIGYVTLAERDKAEAWLREVHAPSGVWVITAPPDERTSLILKMLGDRRDRAQFMLTGSFTGLEPLLDAQVPLLLYRPTRNALGDWRPTSSWEQV